MLSQNKQRARPPPKPPAGNTAAGGAKKTQWKRKEKQNNCRLEERLAVQARAKADSLSSPYTHSLLTMPVASHHSAAGRCLKALIWNQPVIWREYKKNHTSGTMKKKNGNMSLKGPVLLTPRHTSPAAPPQAPLQPTAGQNERPASFKTTACFSNTNVSTLQHGWSVAVRPSPPFKADQTASPSSKTRGVCYQFGLKELQGASTVRNLKETHFKCFIWGDWDMRE